MIISNNGDIWGVDVSKFQSDPIKKIQIDFNKLKNAGCSFVIPKVGQRNYYDYDAAYNWKASKDAGLARSSYWFLDYRETGKLQAQRAIAFFEAQKDFGEGIHFVDYENGSGGSWEQVYDYIAEFQRLSGFPDEQVGVYTGYYYWIENSPLILSERNWFKNHPLWIAWYLKNIPVTSVKDAIDYCIKYSSQVKVPDSWTDKDAVLWQAGTPVLGKLLGMQSFEVDFDILNTNNPYIKYFTLSQVPTPPSTPNDNGGSTNMYNLIVLAAGLNGRSSPSSATADNINFPSNATSGFKKDDLLESDATQKDSSGVDWYRITKLTRAGSVISIPSPCWASAGATYGFMRLYTPVPATNEPAPELYVSLTQGGTQYKYVLVKE